MTPQNAPSIEISTRSTIDKTTLKAKEMDLAVGIIGRLFGSGDNASINISGILVLTIVFGGLGVMWFPCKMEPGDYWKVMLPVVTTTIGYLFGRSK